MNDEVYKMNYDFSETLKSIPLIGDSLLHIQKLACDTLYLDSDNEEKISGCTAVNDVYHGVPERTGVASQRR